jgi:hypothetical protein
MGTHGYRVDMLDGGVCRSSSSSGRTVLDRIIAGVPFEMHLPGYQFLGPGTHLEERLERGQRGKNPLDNACLQHDIAYSAKNTNHTKADRVLAERAFSRMLSETSDGNEKTAAAITVLCMVSKITFDKLFRRVKNTLKRRRKRGRKTVNNRNSNGEEEEDRA